MALLSEGVGGVVGISSDLVEVQSWAYWKYPASLGDWIGGVENGVGKWRKKHSKVLILTYLLAYLLV